MNNQLTQALSSKTQSQLPSGQPLEKGQQYVATSSEGRRKMASRVKEKMEGVSGSTQGQQQNQPRSTLTQQAQALQASLTRQTQKRTSSLHNFQPPPKSVYEATSLKPQVKPQTNHQLYQTVKSVSRIQDRVGADNENEIIYGQQIQKAALSGDRAMANTGQKSSIQQQNHFRSPSQNQLGGSESAPKVTVSLKLKTGQNTVSQSYKSLAGNKISYGQIPMSTSSANDRNRKSPSIFQQMNQYSTNMSKTLGKKSIKLLSNSSFNKKVLNTSNPSNSKKPSVNQTAGSEHYLNIPEKKNLVSQSQKQSPHDTNDKRVNTEGDNNQDGQTQSDYYQTTKTIQAQINLEGNDLKYVNIDGPESKTIPQTNNITPTKSRANSVHKPSLSQQKLLSSYQQKDLGKRKQPPMYSTPTGMKHKFGISKNSVKPPSKKAQGVIQNLTPQNNRLKQSRSSLGLPTGGQNILQTPQEVAYNDLGSRKIISGSPSKNRGDIIKNRTQSVNMRKDPLDSQAATASVFTSPLSMKNASKKGSNLIRQEQFSSQERVLKMAEEENRLLDEMIAQNQKHNLEREKKKNAAKVPAQTSQMRGSQGSPQAFSGTAVNLANNAVKGPQKAQQVKMSLEKNQRGQNSNLIQIPQGQVKYVNNSQQSPSQQMMMTNQNLKQFQTMQSFNRQSPVEVPSSSETSKQSSSNQSASKNQFAPEIKQIGQQFNDIVQCLQNIGDKADQIDNGPQMSNAIAKMYQMKSAYDQIISNMGRQINQLQVLHHQSQEINLHQQQMIHQNQMNDYQQSNKSPYKQPPLSAGTRTIGGAGTGESISKCRHCKGNGFNLSSQGESDRKDDFSDINLQLNGTQKSSGRQQDNLDQYKRFGSDRQESFRKIFNQMQRLAEDNKKISQLEIECDKLKKEMLDKDLQLSQAKQVIGKKQQEILGVQKQHSTTQSILLKLQQSKQNQQSFLGKVSKGVQTSEHLLTEKELDLLVQIKHIERKGKKVEKEKSYNANKISKFIYFFFTLQNKGIPVNEIYEKDGVKFIKTNRFQEIMGQNQGGELGVEAPLPDGEKNEVSDGLSFYSDDSYEYCPFDKEIAVLSKFKNINKIRLDPLNFEGLPEYETTEEDEEEENQGQQPEYAQNELHHVNINSPMPNGQRFEDQMSSDVKTKKELQNQNPAKKQMNKNDYMQSMQYIEKFYQQTKPPEAVDQNDSGFDDLPKSVTEESSMFDNHPQGKKKLFRLPDEQNANGEFNQQFDQSERFDASVNQAKNKQMRIDALDMLGRSIDSETFDQSIINQSINSAKRKMKKKAIKKQKDDLDGSIIFRDQEEESPISSKHRKSMKNKEEMKGQSPNKKQIIQSRDNKGQSIKKGKDSVISQNSSTGQYKTDKNKPKVGTRNRTLSNASSGGSNKK